MQPTAQFYRVTTDNSFPYRVYGAQQDNSTASVSSLNRPGPRERFYAVGGGESGYIAVRPDDHNIVYAGSYAGHLTRYDHALGKRRNIMIWPDNPIGGGAAPLKYRFQWTFPIILSPHDPDVLYVGGNVLFKSTDDGQTWEAISPDLTTNDKTKQQSSGGPITQDNTTVEYYCTIFTMAESAVQKDRLWVGTDDGLVHVSDDGGGEWTNVTPEGMGDWPMISLVEASPHDADTAYLAVTRYKLDDFRPYIYRTRDRGATWDLVVDGIADTAFVRSIREDPVRPGLLFAGTETGMYVSWNEGDDWTRLQRNLPVVPVTDVAMKDNDVVIATQGRSFWILDDISALRQVNDDVLDADAHLFEPAIAYRQRWGAANLLVHAADDVEGKSTLMVVDAGGDTVHENDGVQLKAGMNAIRWNLREEGADRVPGAVGWPGMPPGPRVAPGEYTVTLAIGEDVHETTLTVAGDPRVGTTDEEYAAQVDFLREVRDLLDETHDGINAIRAVRAQVKSVLAQAADAGVDEALKEASKPMLAELTEIEEALIQTRSKSSQDPLNFPVKLNDKIGYLAGIADGDYPLTAQVRKMFDDLEERTRVHLDRLEGVLGDRVESFNTLVHETKVPAVVIPDGDE
jgi:photosystem II stability/assembly factor-like uncharacterized protein